MAAAAISVGASAPAAGWCLTRTTNKWSSLIAALTPISGCGRKIGGAPFHLRFTRCGHGDAPPRIRGAVCLVLVAGVAALPHARPVATRSIPRMGISLQLFGQAHVHHDGQAVALKPDRRCQLLIVLAVRADWVSRDEVAALLWPERSNAEARNNLRKVLHDAGALPWAAGARLTGTALRWSVDTDVAEYTRLLGAGQIEAALDLGAASLLEGFDTAAGAFGDWLAQQRLALAERRRNAVLLTLGDPVTSTARRLAIARRLLATD